MKKFQNAQKKKPVFKFSKTIFFVFKVQTDFYSFSSRFQYENEKSFVFTKILFSKSYRLQMFSKRLFSFSSRFQYENEKIFVFTKILFSKSNRFQMFQNDFFHFPAVFGMKTKKCSFSPKFCFQNLIVFKCLKTIFSVFQPKFQNS